MEVGNRHQSINSVMQIRPYQDSDEQEVIALWNDVLPDSAPHNDPATSIRNKLAVERDLFFVAVESESGPVIGTVMGGYDGHRGWIYSVAVKPDRWRLGLGTSLIRRMEAALVERGCLKVNLQVRSSNSGVVEFYRKLGYAVEERISMGKKLY
jgi:ribosomal protein S18 acetylase RimI-like enzyme